jgi:prophage DNA circulation protein
MASKALMKLPSAWRGDFQPANFKGAFFYCEVGTYECGHRLVIHEFPKKDKPYTESMGRRYYGFTVRGYCIQSQTQPDYRNGQFGRNQLQEILDNGGKGMLQLPFQKPKEVMCRQYRMTEEDRRGGYVVFDMQFVEASELPFRPTPDPRSILIQRADVLRQRALTVLVGQP